MRKQSAVTAQLISAIVFTKQIVQSLYFLYPKFQASRHLLLYSPVCVGPGRKPRRPAFSERGSFVPGDMSASSYTGEWLAAGMWSAAFFLTNLKWNKTNWHMNRVNSKQANLFIAICWATSWKTSSLHNLCERCRSAVRGNRTAD